MIPRINAGRKAESRQHTVILVRDAEHIPPHLVSREEVLFIREQKEKKIGIIPFSRFDHWVLIQIIPEEKDPDLLKESCRKAGDKIQAFLNEQQVNKVEILDAEGYPDETLSLAEGMALGTYQFLKYKTEKDKINTLGEIRIISPQHDKPQLCRLNALIEGVCFTRDLVNEPNCYLTAKAFTEEIQRMAQEAELHLEVLNRKKIEALQMGGLLGVNKGSQEPPAFIIMEYRPPRSRNKKPVVLAGKGIVYDTGGMNLKTGDSMEYMKNDMAGGAAVAGILRTAAKIRMPVYIVGLIPVTDNRPGPGAMVSGDILRMHNGMTVEVVNTDAEGRLILADALSYAVRYDPLLVIDLATLTGSAVRALGKTVIAGMQADASREMTQLTVTGQSVFERIVELPLWEDYAENLKSDIADIKNIGGTEAGAIIAGKFLQKFTRYPYIHLDIAGPAFTDKRDTYRGTGGTGVGVRLMVEFIRKMYEE